MSKINNGAEKKQLDFNNLMKAVSGLNPNKMKHLTEEDLQEQLSLSKETQYVQSPFSYENIIRKSNIEDGQFTTFKLKRETLDMLDAIARGSEKNVSKSTIIHNLVSTFLTENLEKLKAVAAKKIKRDYLK